MKCLIQNLLLAGSLFNLVPASGQSLPPPPQGILYQETSPHFYAPDGARLIPLMPSAYRLDYQSELRIVVNTNELDKLITAFKAAYPMQDSLPPLTKEQEARLAQITPLVAAARTVVRDYDAFITAYEQYKSNPTTTSRQSILDLNRNLAASKVAFLDPLLNYCEAKVRAEKLLARDEQIAIEGNDLAEKFTKVYPGDTGLHIDLPALATFIASETKTIRDQAASDAAKVQANSSISLRMRAFRKEADGDPVRLHIDGYDTLTNANVQQEPRISYQPSERDLARLNGQTKAIAEGIKLSKDLNNSASDLRQSLDSVLVALRGDLRSWKSAATNLDTLQNSLKPVIAALDKAGTSAQLTGNLSNLIVQVKGGLTEVSAEIKTLRDSIESFTGKIDGHTDSAEVLITAMKAATDNVDAISKLATGAIGRFKTTLTSLDAIRADLATLVAQDRPKLQDLAEALKAGAPGSVEAISKLQETALGQYPELVAAFRALWMRTERIAAAANFPPFELDPNLIDVSTVSPPEGLISLKSNFRSGDATLDFSAALIRSNTSSSLLTSRPIENRMFDVEKFGLINTWSASLIFVKRLGDLAPTEERSQFAPAPSISWTLHYNMPPPKDGRFNKWEKTWQTLDPGWGINVATLDWNDSVQIGLGSHVSIFKDVITIGGGWNLNESRHGGYVFVGIGIFEAFGQLGLGKKTAVGR